MRRTGSLNHSSWECKYQVVFIPKYRKKSIFGRIRSELGEIFRRLAEQKESRIEEGHLMSDHVHMMISIPPKYAVSQVIGYMKGKSAIHIARRFSERKRNFVGQHLLLSARPSNYRFILARSTSLLIKCWEKDILAQYLSDS